MVKKIDGPKVSELHIDRRIRRVLLFEIIFVVTLYALLFFVSNIFLNQENKATSRILARFEMTGQVQNLERLTIINSNLVRAYRQTPNDSTFANLVKNHTQLGELLNKTQDKLKTMQPADATQLKEEIKISQDLIKNYFTIISISNAYIGKNVLSSTAQYRALNSLAGQFSAVTSDKSPEQLEADLTKAEDSSIAATTNWSTLIQTDIEEFSEQLVFSQKFRTAILALQAILVVIGLAVMSYWYVLPSFENILKQVVVQNEELLRADAMKTEFISIVSHQLRTPLSAIKWALSLVMKSEKANLNKDQQEMLAEAKTSTETVIDLVSNLLNLSRIEQGRLQFRPKLIDIMPIIEDIVKAVRPQAEKKKITINVTSPAKTAELSADPLLLKEIIQNLVDNAIAYNREGGKVSINARQAVGHWLIDVADTGYGIMPEDLKSLFTKFYRGSNARTIRPDGSGLGLYFIKNLVHMHEGKITVESEPNKGTIFTVALPLKLKRHKLVQKDIPGLSDGGINVAVPTEDPTPAETPAPTEDRLPDTTKAVIPDSTPEAMPNLDAKPIDNKHK